MASIWNRDPESSLEGETATQVVVGAPEPPPGTPDPVTETAAAPAAPDAETPPAAAPDASAPPASDAAASTPSPEPASDDDPATARRSMRKRLAGAASDARGLASSAAAEARGRASNADMNEFAHSTTRLIDTARPFFLAGAAMIFAVLGFLEGDGGTAQIFALSSLLCVIGAAFSGEINAMLHARVNRAAQRPPADD